jgi:transposase
MSSMDDIGLPAPGVEDALTTGRRSARCQRIEVITRGERRRVWDVDQKRDIVLASLQPGVRPADVARHHGINTGLLYTWRRKMLEGQLGGAPRPVPGFARVEIAANPAEVERPGVERSGPDGGSQATRDISPPPLPSGGGGLIEVVLPGGVCVRVDTQVDGRALRRVLAALEGR